MFAGVKNMIKKFIPYDPKLKERARNLRLNSTLAEILLWKYLSGKQLEGYKFHRQKPLYRYIVDFFCSELMLAIEVDGISHDGKIHYDNQRQKFLESNDIKFLRFTENQVKCHMEGVWEVINDWIKHHKEG